LDSVKLAGKTVICENASGVKRRIDLKTFRFLQETYRIANLVQRRKDKAVTHVHLLAEPNEIAKRITAQAEVVKVGASTWIHTRNLGLMGEARG
jgi:hypothetical protein